MELEIARLKTPPAGPSFAEIYSYRREVADLGDVIDLLQMELERSSEAWKEMRDRARAHGWDGATTWEDEGVECSMHDCSRFDVVSSEDLPELIARKEREGCNSGARADRQHVEMMEALFPDSSVGPSEDMIRSFRASSKRFALKE